MFGSSQALDTVYCGCAGVLLQRNEEICGARKHVLGTRVLEIRAGAGNGWARAMPGQGTGRMDSARGDATPLLARPSCHPLLLDDDNDDDDQADDASLPYAVPGRLAPPCRRTALALLTCPFPHPAPRPFFPLTPLS